VANGAQATVKTASRTNVQLKAGSQVQTVTVTDEASALQTNRIPE
jgi:hypothetical protein